MRSLSFAIIAASPKPAKVSVSIPADPNAAPWPQITVRLFNRIRRRARMSASPTCGRSSPRQRSSPAPGNHCLLLRRAGKLQRRPRCQNRKGALPLQRKSRAATHAAVGDKTSWKLLAPTPLSRQIKQTGSRSAVTSITSPRSKKGGPLPRIKKVPAPGCVQARGKPAGARRGHHITRRLWYNYLTSPRCQLPRKE
jgi:hypothetical protein